MRHKMLHTSKLTLTHHCSIVFSIFILLWFWNCSSTVVVLNSTISPLLQPLLAIRQPPRLSIINAMVLSLQSWVMFVAVVVWLFMPELLPLWLTGNYYWFHCFLPYCLVVSLFIGENMLLLLLDLYILLHITQKSSDLHKT